MGKYESSKIAKNITLVPTYFSLKKDDAMLFRLETTVVNFLHLMVLLYYLIAFASNANRKITKQFLEY